MKRFSTIGGGFLYDVSEVAQIKLFVLMNLIRETEWFREHIVECGNFSLDGFTLSLLKALFRCQNYTLPTYLPRICLIIEMTISKFVDKNKDVEV